MISCFYLLVSLQNNKIKTNRRDTYQNEMSYIDPATANDDETATYLSNLALLS